MSDSESVLQNITEGPTRSLGLPRAEAEERAHQLLDMVGLSEKADAHPHSCPAVSSSGWRSREHSRCGRTCCSSNEVTSALDPELVAGVLALLRDIANSTDITFLCVTHEMGFARDVSDRVMMFDHGHIVEEAPPDRLFTEPDHERTRAFLSARAGTRLNGRKIRARVGRPSSPEDRSATVNGH